MSIPALRVIVAGLEKQREHLEHLIVAGVPTVQDIRDIKAEQQRFLELALAAVEPEPSLFGVGPTLAPPPPLPPPPANPCYAGASPSMKALDAEMSAAATRAVAQRSWWKWRK